MARHGSNPPGESHWHGSTATDQPPYQHRDDKNLLPPLDATQTATFADDADHLRRRQATRHAAVEGTSDQIEATAYERNPRSRAAGASSIMGGVPASPAASTSVPPDVPWPGDSHRCAPSGADIGDQRSVRRRSDRSTSIRSARIAMRGSPIWYAVCGTPSRNRGRPWQHARQGRSAIHLPNKFSPLTFARGTSVS